MAAVQQPLTDIAPAQLAPRRSTMSRNDRIWRYVTVALLLIMGTIMIAPFLWLVSSSLKSQVQIFQYPPDLIPNPVKFENYFNALTYKPFGLYLRNTLVIAGLNVIAVVFTSSFVAYGFARLRFPGRDFWFGIVIATLFLPYAIMIVPQFIMFSRLGWVDTFLPLTVPMFFGGGAFNIFLIRQFFRTIPEELADAARIDGCSEFGVLRRIMLPLIRPALVFVVLQQFLGAWKDFFGPLIYLQRQDQFTLSLGLQQFQSAHNTDYALLMACSALFTIPLLVLFFFGQRYFIEGVTLTGLKG